MKWHCDNVTSHNSSAVAMCNSKPRVLGTGTFGTVLAVRLCDDQGDTATVAFKVFNEDDPTEMRLLETRLRQLTEKVEDDPALDALLASPRAMQAKRWADQCSGIYAKYRVQSASPVVLSCVCGPNLFSAPPISLKQRVEVARELLWACALFIGSGMLHLDLKPGNLVWRDRDRSNGVAFIDHDSIVLQAEVSVQQPMPGTLSPIGLRYNKLPLEAHPGFWALLTSEPVLQVYAMMFAAAQTMVGQSHGQSVETIPAIAREYYRVQEAAGKYFPGKGMPFPPLEWVLLSCRATPRDVKEYVRPTSKQDYDLWNFLIEDDAKAAQEERTAFKHTIAEWWLGPNTMV